MEGNPVMEGKAGDVVCSVASVEEEGLDLMEFSVLCLGSYM